MTNRTFKTCVVLFLLAAILAVPCAFADGGGILPTDPGQQVNVHPSSPVPGDDNVRVQTATPSMPVPGDDVLQPEPRPATPLLPDAVQDLPFLVQVFSRPEFICNWEAEATSYSMRVRAYKLSKHPPHDQRFSDEELAVRIISAGTAKIKGSVVTFDQPETTDVTALVYNPNNLSHMWYDTVRVVFTRQTVVATPTGSLEEFNVYLPVYKELAQSIADWRTANYTRMPKNDLKEAMKLIFGAPRSAHIGQVEDGLLHLSTLVMFQSDARYELFRPTMEQYAQFGGKTYRTPFVLYLLRRTTKATLDGSKAFALFPDGTTDIGSAR